MNRQFHLRALAFAQGMLLLASILLPALAAATEITTDLWVYQDGDTVTVSGIDYGANEVVDFVTTDPLGVVVDTGSASSDALGNVTYAFVLHATEAGIYDVVGTGETSGLTAATQFDPVNITIANSGLTSYANGANITISGTYTCSSPQCTTATSVLVEVFLTNGTNNTVSGAAVLTATAGTFGAGSYSHTFVGGGTTLADGSKYDVRASLNFTGGTGTSPNRLVKDEILLSDKIAPAAPNVTGTNPVSPSPNNSPTVDGTAEGGVTVRVYPNSSCSGPALGTGTASGGGTFAVSVTVASDLSTDLYARATDAAGNLSACSSTHVVYVEDSTNDAPVLTGSTPASPSQNAGPFIDGTAEPGSSVSIYKNSGCSGTHDDGSAPAGSFSIAVSVGNNSTTTFWGKSTDAAGNVSACSSTSVVYNADNNNPTVVINTTPTNPTTSTNAGFTFTASDAGGSASGVAYTECKIDGASYAPCSSPFSQVVGTGSHTFSVRVTDNAGNVSTAATFTWTVNISNTPPTVTVGGVSNGGSYEIGSVPSATCNVVDLEDGNSSFAATLSSISGPNSGVGLGSQTASCSYTDGGGLNDTDSATYDIVDTADPTITYFITGAQYVGFEPWYASATVTIDWFVNDNTAIDSSTGCDQLVISDDVNGQVVTCSATDVSGNTFENSVTIYHDATAPSIVASRSVAPNANGWNNTDVTVSFACSDNLSGVNAAAIGTSCDDWTFVAETPLTGVTAYGQLYDNAGNFASTSEGPVMIDRTGPSISGSRSPAANANGWNNVDVTTHYTCSDALSGVDTLTADQIVSTEASGQSRSGTCTDLAGNSAGTTVSNINIDKTAPSMGGSASPAANGNGWNNTDVTVTFSCVDTLSGVDSFSPTSTLLSSEGAGQSASSNCADMAGNPASKTVSGVNIDKTAPTMGGSASPAANGNGWNNTNVTVSFTCNDGLSGVDSFSPTSTVLSTEGAGQSATSNCTDQAGNPASNTVSGINIDKTAPSVTCLAAAFILNQPGTTVSATVADALSGAVASPVSAAVSSATAGSFSVSLTGQDLAGNSKTSSCTYTVGYNMTALSAPVDRPNTLNVSKAGQAIPLKWRLTDYNGVGVTSLTAVTVSVVGVTCDLSSTLDQLEEYAAGSSGLQNQGNGYYQFNWKSPASYANSCKSLSIRMGTNVGDPLYSDLAYFKFTK
jgi:hypothetical protein